MKLLKLEVEAGSGMVKGRRRGHFFCAAVGDRRYLRFVPFEGGPIASEIGTCLRLIECSEKTPLVIPLDLKQTAFSAWERARQDIFRSWMHETDPANLQPRVAKFNRELAQFLRNYPPADVAQPRFERALDAIESPCSRRDELALREVYSREMESDEAKSKALVDEVERLGLEPFQASAPLPPISPAEIHLICWMALEQNIDK